MKWRMGRLSVVWREPNVVHAEEIRAAVAGQFHAVLGEGAMPRDFEVDLVALLRSGFVPVENVRVAIGGRPVPRARYSVDQSIARRPGSSRLKIGALRRLVASGATIIVDDVDRLVPAVSEGCDRLAWALFSPAQASVYITGGTASGLSPHSDVENVVVCQLSGAKSWLLWPEGENGTPCEFILAEGDRLFVPAGMKHAARTVSTEPSVHITFGIAQVSPIDQLTHLMRESWIEDATTLRELLSTDARGGCLTNFISRLAQDEGSERIWHLLQEEGRRGAGIRLGLHSHATTVDSFADTELRPGAFIIFRQQSPGACLMSFADKRYIVPEGFRDAWLTVHESDLSPLDDVAYLPAEALNRIRQDLQYEGIVVPSSDA